MIDWILFIMLDSGSISYDRILTIDNFTSQQACEQAYDDIKDQTGLMMHLDQLTSTSV